MVTKHCDEQLAISDNKRRYLKKIKDIGNAWFYESRTLQADLLPFMRSTDTNNYFAFSTSFSNGEQFKAYESMDSYKYFASGFVSQVGGRVVGDYFVVVGNVSTMNLTKCMINHYHYIGISSLRLIINYCLLYR